MAERTVFNRNIRESLRLDRSFLKDIFFISLGALIQALAMRMFLIPALLVSGGVSGLAQIINYYTNWPIGVMVIIGNIPLFIIGWRYLGGLRFAFRTGLAVLLFSVFTDLLALIIPAGGITKDLFINSLYGGLILGVGLGFVYRGQGTSGGSDILGKILNHRLGLPMSQSYLAVDALVVLAGGFAFNWEHALYGLVVIYVSGLSAEMVSEGTGIFRTVLIVTSKPEEVCGQILNVMERGVTILAGTGAYTGAARPVLYCVITRSEVNQLKALVHDADPKAFMVIGVAHEALGEGFKALKS